MKFLIFEKMNFVENVNSQILELKKIGFINFSKVISLFEIRKIPIFSKIFISKKWTLLKTLILNWWN